MSSISRRLSAQRHLQVVEEQDKATEVLWTPNVVRTRTPLIVPQEAILKEPYRSGAFSGYIPTLDGNYFDPILGGKRAATPSSGTPSTAKTDRGVVRRLEFNRETVGNAFASSPDRPAFSVTAMFRRLGTYQSSGPIFVTHTSANTSHGIFIGSYLADQNDGMRFRICTGYNASKDLFATYNNGSHPLSIGSLGDLWHIITFSWGADDGGVCRIYLDGEYLQDGTNTHTGNAAHSQAAVTTLYMGMQNSTNYHYQDLGLLLFHDRRFEGAEAISFHRNIGAAFR